jgi:hypothetical protein
MRAHRILLSGLLGVFAFAAAHGESATVQAVWKPEKMTMSYFSPTTYYSCDALETKMQRILDQLGLIGRVRVRAADCARGVVSMPNVHIEALVPAPATPEVVASIKKDESYRELVKRVNGKRDQKVEAGQSFAAQWQDVKLGRGLDLTGSDCDLLRQVQRVILPKLAVKIKDSNRTCDSRDASSIREPYLDLQVLMPAPTPDKAAE